MNRTSIILSILALATLHAAAKTEEGDSLGAATYMPQIVVEAPLSRGSSASDLAPIAHTVVDGKETEKLRITDIKEMSAWTPNLYIPDYGARMTSSVYIRGLGSRIDQPAMGLYIDGIPYLNKNTYDFTLCDISRIAVLRGPQNTLYGRNAMGGVMDIKTLSPLEFQGVKAAVEGGNSGYAKARVSVYSRRNEHFGLSMALHGSRSDGFYTNTYKHSSCDWSNHAGANFRMEGHTQPGMPQDLHWLSTTAIDWVNQGGFPYQQISEEDGHMQAIAYNDRCAYNRLMVRQGLTIDCKVGASRLSSATSYTYVSDHMYMDQDFTYVPVFTLQQQQHDHTVGQDFTLKPWHTGKRWRPLTGASVWWRSLHTGAPVLFKRTGIERLILGPANKGIQMMYPSDTLSMDASELPIDGRFRQQYYGASLFHNSRLDLTHGWTLALGGRLEYEGQRFGYDSHSQLAYHISSPDGDIDKTFPASITGHTTANYLQWAPSAGITYQKGDFTWHSSLSRGYKAGGFNTQLFSELVRQQMSDEVIRNYLSIPDKSPEVRQTTRYKPEFSWNAETGIMVKQGRNKAALTLFYTDCRHQQLTVFPEGLQTGRMMTNAGHSRIWGMEAEAARQLGRLGIQCSYGFTHATFLDFPDGTVNHRGKRIPYVPTHTLAAGADYHIALPHPEWLITLHADVRCIGPIWWNEDNSERQDFYALPGASLRVVYRDYSLTVWGRNLSSTHYSTFYFESVGNRFVQRGKPLQWGATLSMTI